MRWVGLDLRRARGGRDPDPDVRVMRAVTSGRLRTGRMKLSDNAKHGLGPSPEHVGDLIVLHRAETVSAPPLVPAFSSLCHVGAKVARGDDGHNEPFCPVADNLAVTHARHQRRHERSCELIQLC